MDVNLSLATTKRMLVSCLCYYYGTECWVILQKHEKRLNSFHHRCIRNILGISNRQHAVVRAHHNGRSEEEVGR